VKPARWGALGSKPKSRTIPEGSQRGSGIPKTRFIPLLTFSFIIDPRVIVDSKVVAGKKVNNKETIIDGIRGGGILFRGGSGIHGLSSRTYTRRGSPEPLWDPSGPLWALWDPRELINYEPSDGRKPPEPVRARVFRRAGPKQYLPGGPFPGLTQSAKISKNGRSVDFLGDLAQ
jgi:hypothetical protein